MTTGLDIITYQMGAHDAEYSITKPAPKDAPGSVYAQGGRLDIDLSQGKPYEQAFLEEIYTRNFKGTAVDVGAHIGNHSIWMAAVCGLNVQAFEPDERAFVWLERNVDENRLEGRVHVHRVALGAHAGQAAWHHTTRGRIVQIPSSSNGGYLPVHTLDMYKLQDVALIKIDVEGTEREVLHGAVDTLKHCHPIVYAEATTPQAQDNISTFLERFDYSMDGIVKVSSPLGRWV